MQTELMNSYILTIVMFLIGAGIVSVALIWQRTVFSNCSGCFVILGAVLIAASIFIAPIGVEEYNSQVTVLKTENTNEVWNMYFDDGGNIRSVRCSEDNPWYSWKEGELVQIQYGKVNSLVRFGDDTHYQLINKY